MQPLVYSNNGTTTVTHGGNLAINSTGAGAFPELNGTFTMDPVPSGITSGLVFNYRKRVGNTLQKITLADPRKIWHDFPAPNTTKIILAKFLKVYSTGTAPSGFERKSFIIHRSVYPAANGQKRKTWIKKWNSLLLPPIRASETHSVTGGKLQVTSVVDPTTITCRRISWLGIQCNQVVPVSTQNYANSRYMGCYSLGLDHYRHESGPGIYRRRRNS